MPKLFLARALGMMARLRYANLPAGPRQSVLVPAARETHVFKRLLCVLAHLVRGSLRFSCGLECKTFQAFDRLT
jgi:hypothetical protein